VAISFFAPPRRIETTVFTRLPNRFRRLRCSARTDAHLHHRLQARPDATGAAERRSDAVPRETVGPESFQGVNDLVFGRSGTLYFTDQGQTGM
jgi:hypothetical protein